MSGAVLPLVRTSCGGGAWPICGMYRCHGGIDLDHAQIRVGAGKSKRVHGKPVGRLAIWRRMVAMAGSSGCLLSPVRLAKAMDMLNDASGILEGRTPKRSISRGLSVAVLAAASLATLASCTSIAESTPGAGGPTDRVAEGRQFASLRCAACHAIDRDDFGPNRTHRR